MDNALLQADIFFFVTTISVAVLTILLIIAWIYGIKIMRNIRYITDQARLFTDKAKIEGDFLIDEIHTMTSKISRNRFNIFALIRLITSLFKRYKYYV